MSKRSRRLARKRKKAAEAKAKLPHRNAAAERYLDPGQAKWAIDRKLDSSNNAALTASSLRLEEPDVSPAALWWRSQEAALASTQGARHRASEKERYRKDLMDPKRVPNSQGPPAEGFFARGHADNRVLQALSALQFSNGENRPFDLEAYRRELQQESPGLPSAGDREDLKVPPVGVRGSYMNKRLRGEFDSGSNQISINQEGLAKRGPNTLRHELRHAIDARVPDPSRDSPTQSSPYMFSLSGNLRSLAKDVPGAPAERNYAGSLEEIRASEISRLKAWARTQNRPTTGEAFKDTVREYLNSSGLVAGRDLDKPVAKFRVRMAHKLLSAFADGRMGRTGLGAVVRTR